MSVSSFTTKSREVVSSILNDPTVPGISLLAFSSGLSFANSLHRASLGNEELTENQIENIYFRVVTVISSLLFLTIRDENLSALRNQNFFLCAVLGGGTHLCIRNLLTFSKESKLTEVLGIKSATIKEEYLPFEFDNPQMDPPRHLDQVKLSYERIEKRSSPSLLDSALRSAHSITTIAHLFGGVRSIPFSIGIATLCLNVSDQIIQPWSDNVLIKLSLTPLPSTNIPYPVEGGLVARPVYFIEYQEFLMSSEKPCSSNCKNKTRITVGKYPLCSSCIKEKTLRALTHTLTQLNEGSSTIVKKFEAIPLSDDKTEEDESLYNLTVEFKKSAFSNQRLYPTLISGKGLLLENGIKTGNVVIEVAFQKDSIDDQDAGDYSPSLSRTISRTMTPSPSQGKIDALYCPNPK